MELVFNFTAHSLHRALDYSGQDVGLPIGHQPRGDVEHQNKGEQTVQFEVVNPLRSHHPVDDDVGCAAKQLWPNHRERHAANCEQQHQHHSASLRLQL